MEFRGDSVSAAPTPPPRATPILATPKILSRNANGTGKWVIWQLLKVMVYKLMYPCLIKQLRLGFLKDQLLALSCLLQFIIDKAYQGWVGPWWN